MHLKTAQDELHNAQAALAHVTRVMTMGELAASIAHEINQPRSGILTNANTCLRILAADQPNVEGARETARRTIRDANRASEVISHLRALFVKKAPAADRFDMSEAADEVMALCSGDLQRKGALLRSEFAWDSRHRQAHPDILSGPIEVEPLTNSTRSMQGSAWRSRTPWPRGRFTNTRWPETLRRTRGSTGSPDSPLP